MNAFLLRRLAAAAIPPGFVAVATGLWLLLVATLVVPALGAARRGSGAATLALALAATGLGVGAAAPAHWLRLRAGERAGRVYTRLGVRRFRRIAFRGDIMNRVQRRIAGGLGVAGVSSVRFAPLIRWTRRNERIHWAWVLATPALVAWAATHGRPLTAALVLAAMVPLNLYPIALQRYTRGRLEAAMRARLAS